MKVQPSHDGKGNGVSFVTLMALEKINDSTYRSLTAAFESGGGVHRPWNTGGPAPRAYGGFVFAQAVFAAAQTVAKGFVVHVCGCLDAHRAALCKGEKRLMGAERSHFCVHEC